MREYFKRQNIAHVLLAAMLLSAPTHYAFAAGEKQPNTAAGGNWSGTVQTNAAPAPDSNILTPDQMQSIQSVNKYFNEVRNLTGRFTQTNPDRSVQRGKFYLMRPGRFRFNYNRPSRQVIISDGKYLAIQDLDLNNDDVHSLENTPFRILLREDVDLLRDARIMAVEQSADQIAVSITDKSPDSPGLITIYLTATAVPELAGWVTTDVQGGVTKVEVSDIDRPEKLDSKLFVREKLFMKSIR